MGTLPKLHVSHFITTTVVNVTHYLCGSINYFLDESSKRLGFCLLKVGISQIAHNQNMNKGHGLALANIIVMKWDTCSFRKVPLFDVLHHIYKKHLNLNSTKSFKLDQG